MKTLTTVALALASISAAQVHAQAQDWEPIRTSPSLSQLAPELAQERSAKSDKKIVASTLKEWGTAPADDYLWLLSGDKYPAPLNYLQFGGIGRLYISYNDDFNMRVQLPGELKRFIDSSEHTVNQYLLNASGMLHKALSRDLEQLTMWKTTIERQFSLLETDWEKYVFTKKITKDLEQFVAFSNQTSKEMRDTFTKEIQSAIATMTRHMNSLVSYEMQMRWYDMIERSARGYEQFTAVVDDYEYKVAQLEGSIKGALPERSVPLEPPPAKPKPGELLSFAPKPIATPSVISIDEEELRTPAPVLQEMESKESMGLVGWLITLLAIAGIGFGVLKPLLNRRKKN